jgi:hypothetical protein
MDVLSSSTLFLPLGPSSMSLLVAFGSGICNSRKTRCISGVDCHSQAAGNNYNYNIMHRSAYKFIDYKVTWSRQKVTFSRFLQNNYLPLKDIPSNTNTHAHRDLVTDLLRPLKIASA